MHLSVISDDDLPNESNKTQPCDAAAIVHAAAAAVARQPLSSDYRFLAWSC